MLLVTFFAPQLLAIRVAAPLLPAFLAVPVKVASPLLTDTLKPWSLSLAEAANLSWMHFCISASLVGVAVLGVLALLVFAGLALAELAFCAVATPVASVAIKMRLPNRAVIFFMFFILLR